MVAPMSCTSGDEPCLVVNHGLAWPNMENFLAHAIFDSSVPMQLCMTSKWTWLLKFKRAVCTVDGTVLKSGRRPLRVLIAPRSGATVKEPCLHFLTTQRMQIFMCGVRLSHVQVPDSRGDDDVYFVKAEEGHFQCCLRYMGVNTEALSPFSGHAKNGNFRAVVIFSTLSAKANVYGVEGYANEADKKLLPVRCHHMRGQPSSCVRSLSSARSVPVALIRRYIFGSHCQSSGVRHRSVRC